MSKGYEDQNDPPRAGMEWSHDEPAILKCDAEVKARYSFLLRKGHFGHLERSEGARNTQILRCAQNDEWVSTPFRN
jgi:hypothetical protein